MPRQLEASILFIAFWMIGVSVISRIAPTFEWALLGGFVFGIWPLSGLLKQVLELYKEEESDDDSWE